MVNISALITDGQQILLFQNDKNEKNEYALPSVCASTLVGAKRKLGYNFSLIVKYIVHLIMVTTIVHFYAMLLAILHCRKMKIIFG